MIDDLGFFLQLVLLLQDQVDDVSLNPFLFESKYNQKRMSIIKILNTSSAISIIFSDVCVCAFVHFFTLTFSTISNTMGDAVFLARIFEVSNSISAM